MIVSRTHDGLTVAFDRNAGCAAWRCLGRRGMLFSECESFDYVRLAPGAVLDERGRGDIEEAWFVLRGSGEFTVEGEAPLHVEAGRLVLCPHRTGGTWRGVGDSALELLVLALMPASVSRRLPTRTPAD
ncbi:cupin domain-containing protein [Saccharothrix obliqua]|uniref:cupin domain-containing protein n=1 Tax=Saccharothrix obliqua TaxID=2861747 RepID=UPI001C5DC2E0|nr:cupin domain-containing protein [Saccharothrix obliqua]MBW4722185.1 cupin domain-containing protein [Saccharothrix obliqua]